MVRQDVARVSSVAVLAAALSLYPAGSSAADESSSEAPPGQETPSDVEVPGLPVIAGDASTLLRVEAGSDDAVTMYSASSGDELWQGSLPFDTPIAYPHAVAVGGDSYAVVGVPCLRIERVEDWGPVCGPGGLSLATLDRDSRAWEVVQSAAFSGTEWLRVLGEHGGSLIVQLGGSIVSVPLDGGPPVKMSDAPVKGFTTVCMNGSRVAVLREVHDPGDPSPEPGEWSSTEWRPFSPFESAVLDLDTNVWTATGGPDATHNRPQSFATGCAGGNVLAVPRRRPREAAETYVTHQFDIQNGTWSPAEPPPAEFKMVGPTAWTGEDFILFVTTDESNRVLTLEEGGRWISTVGGQGGEVQSAALAGNRLVTLAHDQKEPLFSSPDGRFPEVEPPTLPSADAQLRELSETSLSTPNGDVAALGATVTIHSHQWNMCGASCNAGDALPSAYMLERFNFFLGGLFPQPWSISLNEVCLLPSNQEGLLLDYLLDAGYSVGSYTALSNAPNCSGADFGNLVFNLGPVEEISTLIYTDQDPGANELRGAVCMENAGFLGDWLGCSTHMMNDGTIAASQSDELFGVLAWSAGSMFRIVGGDFNLTPIYPDDPPLLPVLDKWRDDYVELNEAPPYEQTLTDGRKLDYKWFYDSAEVVSTSFDTEFWTFNGEDLSDHAYYYGWVSFEV